MKPIDPLCERTRAWASLELDGELSELEGVLFYEHVRGCEECAAAVDDLRRIGAIVRATPLAEPSRAASSSRPASSGRAHGLWPSALLPPPP